MEKGAYKKVFSDEKWHLSDELMKEVTEAINLQLTNLEKFGERGNYSHEELERMDIRARFDKEKFAELKHLRITKENFKFKDLESLEYASGYLGMALGAGNKGLGEPAQPCTKFQTITLYGLDTRAPVVKENVPSDGPYAGILYGLSHLKTIDNLFIEACKIDAEFLQDIVTMLSSHKNREIDTNVIFKGVQLKDPLANVDQAYESRIKEYLLEGRLRLEECDLAREQIATPSIV